MQELNPGLATVRRLAVEEASPLPRRTAISESPSASTPIPIRISTQPSTLEVVVTSFVGLGYALSARSLLLLSLIGAFVLGLKAMDLQTPLACGMLAVYCAFTVCPVAYLEVRRRA